MNGLIIVIVLKSGGSRITPDMVWNAALASQWVSVKECGLPDEGVPVWARRGDHIGMYATMSDVGGWVWGVVESYWFADGKWHCDYEVDDDYSGFTHYMFLPELPK